MRDIPKKASKMKKLLTLLTFGLTGCTVTPAAYYPEVHYRSPVVYPVVPSVQVYPRYGYREHREHHGRHHDD